MSYHVRDYHDALEKVQQAPLTLTERDVDVLREFGGPQDEARGRAALRKAQLAVLGPPAPKVKTAAAPPSRSRGLRLDVMAQHTAAAIRDVVTPLRDSVAQLTQRVTDLEATTTRQAATITELRDENRAIGKLVTRDLQPPNHSPCLDDLTPGSPKH